MADIATLVETARYEALHGSAIGCAGLVKNLADAVAALTAENERLKAVAEEVRTVRYTLMYVSSLLCEPVTDKNIRNARKAMEPLYYDALRDVKAERAALPSSRETTDGGREIL